MSCPNKTIVFITRSATCFGQQAITRLFTRIKEIFRYFIRIFIDTGLKEIQIYVIIVFIPSAIYGTYIFNIKFTQEALMSKLYKTKGIFLFILVNSLMIAVFVETCR